MTPFGENSNQSAPFHENSHLLAPFRKNSHLLAAFPEKNKTIPTVGDASSEASLFAHCAIVFSYTSILGDT